MPVNNSILRRIVMVLMLFAFATPLIYAQKSAPSDYESQRKLSEKNAKKLRKAAKKQAKKDRKANAKSARDYKKKHPGSN